MSENNDLSAKHMDYDVIFVGQLGAVVCSMLLKSSSQSHKCLVINNSHVLKEPALLPAQSSSL